MSTDTTEARVEDESSKLQLEPDTIAASASPKNNPNNSGLGGSGSAAGSSPFRGLRSPMSTEPLKIPERLQISKSMLKMSKETLGKGGFAQVVAGELTKHDGTKLPVAVKVMDKSHVSRTAFLNVQNEIDICATLSHPCIINTHAIFEDQDSIYIAMDLAQGGELFKYMKKFGLEDMPLLAPKFIGEVVLGLEYMQMQQIIHRDIKPENLLLTGEYHVKIADFGTVCRLDEENSNFTGTALYVSPEMLVHGKASRTSDVWALGCVLYQLFVGRPPFTGQSEYYIMQAVRERKFDFPPYFPDDAKDLVDKMLTTDPEKRIGANGFDEIKKHPFFRKIDWATLLTQSNVTYLNADYSKQWENFLLEGERVVYSSKITKERYKAFSVKQRILILTDYPRLFYIDPQTHVYVKQVPWSDSICAQADSTSNFHVHTPDRTYHFIDSENRAHLWSAKINDQVKRKK